MRRTRQRSAAGCLSPGGIVYLSRSLSATVWAGGVGATVWSVKQARSVAALAGFRYVKPLFAPVLVEVSHCFFNSVPEPNNPLHQVAPVEGVQVKLGLARERFDACFKTAQGFLAAAPDPFRFFHFDGFKADFLTRITAPQDRQVGRDDGGDLRVAAGCLVVGEKDNRIAGAGNLDRSGCYAVRDDVVST